MRRQNLPHVLMINGVGGPAPDEGHSGQVERPLGLPNVLVIKGGGGPGEPAAAARSTKRFSCHWMQATTLRLHRR